jgi:hypothetical protein
MRTSIFARATLLFGLAAGPALADAAPKFHNAWYLPVGISGGVAIHDGADDGFVGGLEASIVRNDDYNWMGAYADVVHDFAADTTRISLGPELGEAIFGIDGGYVLETGGGRTRHGVAVRPMFSLGVIMLYGRLEWLATEPSETLGEVGLLLKVPIELHNEPAYHGRPDLEPEPPYSEPPVEPAPDSAPPPAAAPSGPFAEPPPG